MGTNTVFGHLARKSIVGGKHFVVLGVYNGDQAGLATAISSVTVTRPARSA